jgi:uncharacterized protein (TIGR02246 family)
VGLGGWRRGGAVAMVIVASLVAVAGRGVAQSKGAADEQAVRAVVARYVEAREKRDATALAALFVADADQLVSSGEWRRGKEAVVSGGLASSARSAGTRTIQVEYVRVVAPDVAIADGRYEIGGAAGAEARRMWTTFVMARGADGGWRISAIRNMLPAAP